MKIKFPDLFFNKVFQITSVSVAVIAFSIVNMPRWMDFDVYLRAAGLMLQHGNIYYCAPGQCMYFYSPFFALILSPFFHLSFYIVYSVWTLLNVYFLYRIAKLIRYFLPVSIFDRDEIMLFFLVSLVLVTRFLLYNVDRGQMTVFLVYASLESLKFIITGKNWQGALLLALACNFKLLPLVFVPFLIYKGYFKATALFLLFTVMFLYLPAVFIGFQYNNEMLKTWWQVTLNPQATWIEPENELQSLTALIPTLLMKTKGYFDLPRNIADLSESTVKTVILISQLILIVWTLWFMRNQPFKKVKSNFEAFYAISYLSLITPLIAPHQQKYEFFYMLPAYAYIVYYLMINAKSGQKVMSGNKKLVVLIFLILSFLLCTITTDGIIGLYANRLSQFYRLITYGTLILIIPLSICTPEKLEIQVQTLENPGKSSNITA